MIKINIDNGYNGGAVKIKAFINKDKYIIELDNVISIIKNAIEFGMYEVVKEKTQRIPRLKITEGNIVDRADACELAHELTVRECDRRKINVDCLGEKDCGDDGNDHNDEGTHYGSKAQDIFNDYLDLVDNKLNI